MSLSFDLERERVPCIYEILYQAGNPPALKLRLQKNFVQACKDLSPIILIEASQKKHNLGEFSPLGNDWFGFNNTMAKTNETGEFIEYTVIIPVLRKELQKPCSHCKGTGRDDYFDRACSWCDGTTHEIEHNWKPFTAISATLEMLTNMAEFFKGIGSAEKFQLLSFQVRCGKKMGSWSIGGTYGIDFCNWLSGFSGHHQFSRAIEAMQKTYRHIFGKTEHFSWYFDVYTEDNAWLIISCPGDACSLYPSDYGWAPNKNMGRKFSCHNMDAPMQQLMLLTALAALSDMARETIK
ncbi:MAG: hypothetical protein PHG23_01650 [Candidatus Pacebacteria bacterium]|nr:hypothetical protein [Candidatus Paceibacterota bacterium]